MSAVSPNVTLPLSEYARLQAIEGRARGCRQMVRHKVSGELARLDAYAMQFVDYILDGPGKGPE